MSSALPPPPIPATQHALQLGAYYHACHGPKIIATGQLTRLTRDWATLTTTAPTDDVSRALPLASTTFYPLSRPQVRLALCMQWVIAHYPP